MNPTNQTSMVLESELNNAPSVFPVNVKTIHKLKLFAPSGKVNAIYTFSSISELRHFIELNQPPRYDVYA
jgi:CTP:phosphocholine cytidylyltransferase-like protein